MWAAATQAERWQFVAVAHAFCASPKAILGLPAAPPIEVSDVNQCFQG